MSDRVQEIVKEISEYLTAAAGSSAKDAQQLTEATERIALLIGDNGLKPGFAVRLRNGAVYHVEPAFFRDHEGERPNTGQLLCRNWRSLEPTDTVVPDAQAHAELDHDGTPLPNVWEEEVRERATIEDRKAFLRELPELARRLRTHAQQQRDPEITKAARLAQKLAEVIEAEVAGPGVA